ncbi:MAG: hypothetical protein HC834_11320 [Rhodospirillales bacterium]|nr:hypothetical protein [Rhodospirillales bacterium]
MIIEHNPAACPLKKGQIKQLSDQCFLLFSPIARLLATIREQSEEVRIVVNQQEMRVASGNLRDALFQDLESLRNQFHGSTNATRQ